MALSDLIATREHFGPERAFMVSVLDRYNEEEEFEPAEDITELFLADALRELRTRLVEVTGYPLTWPGYDASVGATDTVAAWQHIISRLQLAMLYDWLPEGEGSENDRRRKRYRAEFEAALVGLRSVLSDGGATIARTVTMRL